MLSGLSGWLEPMRDQFDAIGPRGWDRLTRLANLVEDWGDAVGTDRCRGSGDLLRTRRHLVGGHGFVDDGRLWQLLAQFLCGHADVDLRDATGLGHGRLVAEHGTSAARERWLPLVRAGAVVGVAVTEAHGGSRVAENRTAAVPVIGGVVVSGAKCWISRLVEARLFVVFFRDPGGGLAAGIIDAEAEGLVRTAMSPMGVAGWSWGGLGLQEVFVPSRDLLRGEGMAVLREHFSVYRPWVAATALGAAARVFDVVASAVLARDTPRHRDTTLVALGRAHMRVCTALLGCAVATYHRETGNGVGQMWGAQAKAHGVDTAIEVVGELSGLLGAGGYLADGLVSKVLRDLQGLRFADGVHDSLWRTCGTHHLSRRRLPSPEERRVVARR